MSNSSRPAVKGGILAVLFVSITISVFAKEYNLKNYIPANYAATDQTINVQRMFDDAISGGGGTIKFELPGNDNIPLKICDSLILWTPTDPHGPIGIVIEGMSSVITTCENQEQTLFNTGNLTYLIIKNLQIVSSKAYSAIPDMRTVLRTGYVSRLVLDNVTVAGITVPAKMLEIYYSDVINITNSDFSGNATGFSIIYITGSRLVSISHTKFHDYLELKVKSNNWNFYSDTSWNTGYWIYANDVHVLKTDNLHLDEGAVIQIRVDNSLFTSFNFNSFDVSGVTGGTGVFLNNVKQGVFEQCSTGLATASADLAVLKNNSKATVNYGFLRSSRDQNILTAAKYVSADLTSAATLLQSPQMESRPTNPDHDSWYYYIEPNPQPITLQSAGKKISREILKSGRNLTSGVETGYLAAVEKYRQTKTAHREIEARRIRILEKANLHK